MQLIQLPGNIVSGDKTTFGGAYPIDGHGTGFNNLEWNGYPGVINDRMFPIAHPLDLKRPTCIQYEVHAGDAQPNYNASGERSELWYEPHDGIEGLSDAFCSSWVIPDGFGQMPTSWMFLCQNHPGIGYTDWHWPSLNLANGLIKFEVLSAFKQFDVVQTGRELFLAVEELLSTNGFCRCWLSWDKPPDVTKTPFVEEYGNTLMGTKMWWKTGIYRGKENFTNKVVQTTLARRALLTDAMKAAGWDKITGGVIVVPPPPTINMITQSIINGSTIKGSINWTADNGPCDFLIDGVVVWHENFAPYVCNGDTGKLDTTQLTDGSHTFGVKMSDGSAASSVIANVQNTVVTSPKTNAELRDLANAEFAKTTITYGQWLSNKNAGKYPDILKTAWGRGFDYQSKIK